MIDLTKYTERFKSTEDYKPDDADIIYEYDNYICIIQVASKINNVIFLEKEPIHKQSLLKDAEHIITYINHNYNVRLFSINNRKWHYVLSKVSGIRLLYENEGILIYGYLL